MVTGIEPVEWTDDPNVWEGEFEGYRYGSDVTIIFTRLAGPGGGPKLHKHPYSETFVLMKGEVLFSVGDQEIQAKAGQIVVVPPETPHKFANGGSGSVEMMDIHASSKFITVWLDE